MKFFCVAWSLCLTAAVARGDDFIVKQRTLRLDKEEPGRQENITAVLGRWTVINFPESFDAKAVLCGQCIDVNDLPNEPSARALVPHKWIIDIRPETNSVHVMPNRRPSQKERPETFQTSVYVLLHGGFAVDLQLSLLDLLKPHAHELVADSVVTVEVPDRLLLNGRLKEKIDELEVQYQKRALDIGGAIGIRRQLGYTTCKNIHWKRPYSDSKMVVRLLQICSSDAESKSFWALFSVENLSDATLYLQDAELKPEVTLAAEEQRSGFKQNRLSFEQATLATASFTLKENDPVPSKWQLVVRPKSPDRNAVKVDGITF